MPIMLHNNWILVSPSPQSQNHRTRAAKMLLLNLGVREFLISRLPKDHFDRNIATLGVLESPENVSAAWWNEPERRESVDTG